MSVDHESISEAYHDVRNDDSATTWAVFEYGDKNIISCQHKGEKYDELKPLCTDTNRLYIFARIETGDELSKRAKFAFISWIGEGVSPLKKAKMSTDKAFVKQIVQNFAKELTVSERGELDYEKVRTEVRKAGGANYGTGK